MKYRHKDLLTLLISLFILSGCENPSGVGLEVLPGEEITGHFTDSISVHAFTVRDDSIQSTGFNQNVFGVFKDPVLGTTVADLALEIGMPSKMPRIYSSAEIDSVVLVLPYGFDVYGDTLSSTYALQVRQLDENFTYNTFSTKKWKVKDGLLGNVMLNRYAYRSTDSLLVSMYVDQKDSIVKVAPQLRIPLDKTFFKELFANSVDSASISTAQGFRNHVKGLYLSLDTNMSQGLGQLITFAAIDNISGVELTFRQPKDVAGDEEIEMDTIRTFFPISTYNPNSGANLGMASSVDNQFSMEVEAYLENQDGHVDKVFLHAPVGLRGRISFPYIDELKGQNILINKAELVLSVDESAMEAFRTPSPRLTLYREDIAGRRQNIPDGDALNQYGTPNDPRSMNFINFGGWYDKNKTRYIFHLTSYIQDVLAGKINGNELFIAPVSTSAQFISTEPALNSGSRVILQGPAVDGGTRMKLNVYYTVTGEL